MHGAGEPRPTSLRILLTSASFHLHYGGPAVSVSRLAGILSRRGANVVLWAPDNSAVTTSLLPVASSVHRVSGSVRDALNRPWPIDIVHDNGLWLPHNHRLAVLTRRLGIPRVVSTRGMLEPWARAHKGWKKLIAWHAYQQRDLRQAAALHATAPTEADNLQALGLVAPVHTIANGVDLPDHTDRHAGADHSHRTALFLGRIYPVKGLPMLIDAWAQVRPQNWVLDIAGPDEAGHRQQLEKAVAAAGLGETIRFLGPVTGAAMDRALRGADLFVLPSHSESFGMAIAEALSYGLPVLTTTATPWPQLATNGCGWRVRAAPAAIAAGLTHATSLDPSMLREMGQRGRQLVVREFGWDNLVEKYLQMYCVAIEDAKRQSPQKCNCAGAAGRSRN